MADEEYWGPTQFALGEPWPWEDHWVAQPRYAWFPDADLILLVDDQITDKMLDHMTKPIDMVLVGSGPLVGFLTKFDGSTDWAETLVWRRPDQGIPENLRPSTDRDHLLLKFVLVDARTKAIAHMRAFTLSSHFTRALYKEVSDRWAEGTTREEAAVAVDAWNARYPSTRKALTAGIARCKAGD